MIHVVLPIESAMKIVLHFFLEHQGRLQHKQLEKKCISEGNRVKIVYLCICDCVWPRNSRDIDIFYSLL